MRRFALTVAVALAGLAGCGASGAAPAATPTSAGPPPTPAARAELAARAAAAQDLTGVAFYSLQAPGTTSPTPTPPQPSGGALDRTVMVVRATDGSWRVDIPGGALGGTVDVSMVAAGEALYHCVLAGCVEVDELSAESDPRVHHVFTDWLEVFTDRGAALSVSTAAAPAGMAGQARAAGTGDTQCFAVQPSAASLVAPVDAGIYCYQVDGTLTGAELSLGTLRLAGPGGPAPPSVSLPGPVIPGEPPPTASPSPSGSASPSATPTEAP